MKPILRYSFTLLLVLSCLIVVPVTFFRDTLQTKQEAAASTTLTFTPSTRPRPTTVPTTSTTVSPDGTVNGTDASNLPTAPTVPTVPTEPTVPTPPLSQTMEELFADTLFIGDSRTYGFVSYNVKKMSGATFFSSEGMSASAVLTRSIDVPGVGKTTFDALLGQKQFKQVYIMFGLNELNNGHSNSTIAAWYQQIIHRIEELQPDAKVIVQSVLHVTKAKNDANVKSGGKITNARINELNTLLKQLVDEPYVYFLDINAAFDTEHGALHTEYAAGDGMHVKVRGYTAWRDFLFENRIL